MLKRSRVIWIVIFFLTIFIAASFFPKKQYTSPETNPEVTSETQAPFNPESLSCPDCNVLFIAIDTLGAKHMSNYGYDRDTTPYLNELAKQSIQFNNHYVQIPYTPPSFWSIMTGLYPHTHNLPDPNNIFPKLEERQRTEPLDMTGVEPNEIDENLPVLPRVLNDNGYKTRGQVSFPIMNSFKPVFEEFEIIDEEAESSDGSAFYQTTNKTMDWLTENKDGKFFLFVHYWDVHSPYRPIAEFDVFQARDENDRLSINEAKYDGEILFVDHKIKILMNKVRQLGLDENTIVVITSDHGEQFGEKDCSEFLGEEGRCEAHSVSLFEEEIYTPLMIVLPKNAGSKKIDKVTQSIDIMPTILDLLEISPISDIEGRSLVPLIAGEEWRDGAAFAELSEFTARSASTSIRKESWKLINIYQEAGVLQRLHDLSQNEDQNYLLEKPKIVKNLEDLLFNITQGKRLKAVDKRDLDQNTLQMLKSLGYIN